MGDSDLNRAKEGTLVTTRERAWGQYKRPSDGVLVRLPADPDALKRYQGKGLKLIRTGTENDIPLAILDTSAESLAKIAPVAVLEPELPVEASTPEAEEPELYVSDKPPKEKKTKRKKRKLKT